MSELVTPELSVISAVTIGTIAFIFFLVKTSKQKTVVKIQPRKKTRLQKEVKKEMHPETERIIKELQTQLTNVQDQLVAQKLAPLSEAKK